MCVYDERWMLLSNESFEDREWMADLNAGVGAGSLSRPRHVLRPATSVGRLAFRNLGWRSEQTTLHSSSA